MAAPPEALVISQAGGSDSGTIGAVKITLAPPDADGLRELAVTRPAGDVIHRYAYRLTQHDLNDHEAVLAADKAKARACPAETGEHTCGLVPGPHYAAIHACRACPRTWPQA